MIGLYYIHSHRLHWHWVTIRCLTNYSNILNYVFSYIIHCIIIIDLLKLLIDRFIATVMQRQREGRAAWLTNDMPNNLQICKGVRLAGTGSDNNVQPSLQASCKLS